VLDENIIYSEGYDPSEKMAGDATLDDIDDGVTYSRVLKTDISAGHILLSSAVALGTWYNESGVEIDADTGIRLYEDETTKATLNNNGLAVYGNWCWFYYGGAARGRIAGENGRLIIEAALNNDLYLIPGGDKTGALITGGKYLVLPICTSDPVSPTAGAIWYDSILNVIKAYNGTAIKTMTWS
jgi:hypothetical protein